MANAEDLIARASIGRTEMEDHFIERILLVKNGEEFEEVKIRVSKPLILDSNLFRCEVNFSKIKKYNASIKGVDEFNAMECAIEYVNSICNNSDSPEFFIRKGESMKGFFSRIIDK